jgi:hypothetical protein
MDKDPCPILGLTVLVVKIFFDHLKSLEEFSKLLKSSATLLYTSSLTIRHSIQNDLESVEG